VRRIAAITLALLVLTVGLPASASQGAADRGAEVPHHRYSSNGFAPRGDLARQAAASDAFVANDNFFTLTFNHFGNPANGSTIAETWLETGFDELSTANNTQGVVRAILLPKTLRVSVEVELHGITADDQDELINMSSEVNSSGALTVQAATPEITLATDPHCFYFTVVNLGIRWSDNRLTRRTFSEPVSFSPGPTACSTS
jgi:hypothetical protein